MRLSNCLTEQGVSKLSVLIMLVGLSLTSASAQASFSTPKITSSDNTCPANHKKYSLANTSTNGPALSQWQDSYTSKSFTFSDNIGGNKVLSINFTNILDSVGKTPFYRNSYEDTRNALNMTHNSNRDTSAIENHTISIGVNKPVSKIGYKIQDLDTDANLFVTFYLERAKAINGLLNNVSRYHDPVDSSNGSNTVTAANNLSNCGPNDCTIDAAWGYTPSKSQVSLVHSNAKTTAPFANREHTVGYSDFYFCLAPPKIIVNKELRGDRVNPDDQFRIEVKRDDTVVEAFTTSGSDSTVSSNTTNAVTLAENTSYTITERVLLNGNQNMLGNISNYNASYTCSNATTGSTTVIPNIAMTYDATAKTRQFTLSNLNYADEITCTITNQPNYTFSGTVFNDNGGIPATSASDSNATIDSGLYANSNYFNGIFNSSAPNSESGISGSTVSLTTCNGTEYSTPVEVASDGTYQLSIAPNVLGSNTSVCLVESGNSSFPIRTSSASQPITLEANKYIYTDNNFGRVIAANAALVLTKYQHINNCSSTLDYSSINTSSDPTFTPRDGFSISSISNIQPDECIAYKIVATNRANLDINNFIMSDDLQNKGEGNATAVRVAPTFNARDYATDSVAIGNNGTVKTNALQLAARSKRDFYFNTKYAPSE